MKTIEKICEKCSKPFPVLPKRKEQRFCSIACASGRKFSERRPDFIHGPKKLISHTCLLCGTIFNRRKYPYTPKFCSNSCSAKHQYTDGRKPYRELMQPPSFICKHCGKSNVRRRIIYRGRSIGFDKRIFCNRICANLAQNKGGHIHHSGYRILTKNGKQIPEHRYMMEQQLHRTLKPYENVHHKNGIRDDNRLENLEIWITRQPKGQRCADTLDWAIDYLRSHGFIVTLP